MAQRFEPTDSLDDFPTPPWATRTLIEHVIGTRNTKTKTCLEPACGRGYMAEAPKPYFNCVDAYDIADYCYAPQRDFLNETPKEPVNWVITNPPFRLVESFFSKAFEIAEDGVALLVRTVFIESVGRHERLFSKYPPTKVAQFAERVPIVKGRVDPKASTATGYAWLVWEKSLSEKAELVWIPKCRKLLERADDYGSLGLNTVDVPLFSGDMR